MRIIDRKAKHNGIRRKNTNYVYRTLVFGFSQRKSIFSFSFRFVLPFVVISSSVFSSSNRFVVAFRAIHSTMN